MVSPSDMIALADAPLWGRSRVNSDPSVPLGIRDLGAGLYWVLNFSYPLRHGERWNVGFCDGHVEALLSNRLFNASDPSVARRWNNDHQPHNENFPKPPP